MGGWDAPLGIPLYADGISVLMLIMTAVVGTASTVYAIGYFSVARHGHAIPANRQSDQAFWPLWLILWSALNALFLSSDIFNLYVTLELMTFSAVALIGLAGRAQALVAAIRYLIAAMMGSLFYLLGVALIYSAYGTVCWQMLADAGAGRCGDAVRGFADDRGPADEDGPLSAAFLAARRPCQRTGAGQRAAFRPGAEGFVLHHLCGSGSSSLAGDGTVRRPVAQRVGGCGRSVGIGPGDSSAAGQADHRLLDGGSGRLPVPGIRAG
jgi:hypothetical protein